MCTPNRKTYSPKFGNVEEPQLAVFLLLNYIHDRIPAESNDESSLEPHRKISKSDK